MLPILNVRVGGGSSALAESFGLDAGSWGELPQTFFETLGKVRVDGWLPIRVAAESAMLSLSRAWPRSAAARAVWGSWRQSGLPLRAGILELTVRPGKVIG